MCVVADPDCWPALAGINRRASCIIEPLELVLSRRRLANTISRWTGGTMPQNGEGALGNCELGCVLAGRQAHRQRVLGQDRESLGFSDRQGGECPILSSALSFAAAWTVLTSVFGR